MIKVPSGVSLGYIRPFLQKEGGGGGRKYRRDGLAGKVLATLPEDPIPTEGPSGAPVPGILMPSSSL